MPAAGRHRTSVNRAYYAALNAVRAILILEGVNPETHEGAVTLLSLRPEGISHDYFTRKEAEQAIKAALKIYEWCKSKLSQSG